MENNLGLDGCVHIAMSKRKEIKVHVAWVYSVVLHSQLL